MLTYTFSPDFSFDKLPLTKRLFFCPKGQKILGNTAFFCPDCRLLVLRKMQETSVKLLLSAPDTGTYSGSAAIRDPVPGSCVHIVSMNSCCFHARALFQVLVCGPSVLPHNCPASLKATSSLEHMLESLKVKEHELISIVKRKTACTS